jgi:V/A-type H+/Na+-transporting ATPase subunit E
MAEAIVARGVDQLISRLRDDGVKAGEEQSRRIINEAESRAARIVQEATKEAEAIRTKAIEESKALEQLSQGALRLAGRDAMLELRNKVRSAFEQYVRSLVIQSTADPEFIRSLILILAGEAVEKHIRNKEVHVYLSKAILNNDSSPEMRQTSSHFLKALASELLRKGITLVQSDDVRGGARIRLVRDEVEIDLSDQAVTELLIRHLSPRIREIMSRGE